MKLSSILTLVFCFALTACGGGAGDTLNANKRGPFVKDNTLDQIGIVQTAGDDRRDDTVINEECARLKALSDSGTLTRINILNLEKNGTVRSTYYNEFGLFDPKNEPLATDDTVYVLGKIVKDRDTLRFENTQPAFGKTTVSEPGKEQVITSKSSIQRTNVRFSNEEDAAAVSVNFTTDTVGSFGVEDRASFDYTKVDETDLREMMTVIQRHCLKN